jgi:ATP-dependent protease HslVU (ClpYQ) peptidase subunit
MFAVIHPRVRARSLAIAGAVAVLCAGAGAQQASMEERLRTQLRATTEQLQSAQNELAALKARAPAPAVAAASPAASDPAGKKLEGELTHARSQLTRERAAREQLDARLAALREEAQAAIGRANGQVAQIRGAYDGLLKMARASEAERQRLAADGQFQTAALAQCEAKNRQLYDVGQQVLRAYEGMDLGTLLRSRQPFAAQTRVQYEQIAQQYGDKLYEGRFDPRGVQSPATSPEPAAAHAPAVPTAPAAPATGDADPLRLDPRGGAGQPAQ